MSFASMLKSLEPGVGKHNKSDREHWLKETLLQIPANSRILDAGAGTQQYRSYCNHLQYVSQDFGKYDGVGDSKGIQKNRFSYGSLDIVCDITSIPEPDTSFDAIMCIEVFEHLPNPPLALKEFSRLLKSDGYLILTAPFCSLTHYAPYHFCTGFNKYWYEKYLSEFGFEDIEIKTNGNFFEYIAQEIDRIPSVTKRYSSGKLNIFELITSFLMLRMLSHFSKDDRGSSELLCFGYHIFSKKH